MNSITHIIGIDPGLASLGWGVLSIDGYNSPTTTKSNNASKQVNHLGHGIIATSSKDSLEYRLLAIEQAIDAIFSRYDISILVYEQQFFVKNVTSGLQVAHALGVVLLYAAKQGLRVHSFTPKEIKQQITGNASARKDTVGQFVCMQLGLDIIEAHHSADALGAALSYCYKNSAMIRIAL